MWHTGVEGGGNPSSSQAEEVSSSQHACESHMRQEALILGRIGSTFQPFGFDYVMAKTIYTNPGGTDLIGKKADRSS